jgi:hypothetical protein
VSGKIALIDRGQLRLTVKPLEDARAAGATGLISQQPGRHEPPSSWVETNAGWSSRGHDPPNDGTALKHWRKPTGTIRAKAVPPLADRTARWTANIVYPSTLTS